MKPEAIIFDMDGLMFDSERATRDAYYEVARQDGFDFSDEFYVGLLGKNQKAIFKTFTDHYGDNFPIPEIFKRVHQIIRERYEREGVPVKEGLEDLLKTCRELGLKTVVATSSERNRVDDLLKMTGLTEYFDETICGDEIENGKPNPEIFLKAAAKIGVKPENAWVLEDSKAGIEAAHRAEIPVICVIDLAEPENSNLCLDVVGSLKDVNQKLKG